MGIFNECIIGFQNGVYIKARYNPYLVDSTGTFYVGIRKDRNSRVPVYYNISKVPENKSSHVEIE